MMRWLCLFLLAAIPLVAQDKNYGTLYVERLIHVVDGDTLRVDIEGVHPLLGDNISVRVAGIDTPEIHSKDPHERALAEAAKEFVKELMGQNPRIVLAHVRRDKYFRILADVYVNEQNLAELLLAEGLARPYDGGTKEKW